MNLTSVISTRVARDIRFRFSFDRPVHIAGVTPVPGVYFLGLPWLYTWGSGRFSGVARDAEYLAEYIKARAGSTQPESQAALNEAAIGS